MIHPDQFLPNGDFVLLLKCVNAEPDGIALTDKTLANTNWVEIVALGPKCKLFRAEQIGKLGHVANWRHNLQSLRGLVGDERTPKAEYWVCRETDLKPFVLAD